MKRFRALAMLLVSASLITAVLSLPLLSQPQGNQPQGNQEKAEDKKAEKFSTGLVIPKDIDQRIKTSWTRHGIHLQALPKVTASSWDIRTLGYVPPIQDQMQCGSCYDFAGKSIAEMLLIRAGYGKADGSFTLSAQYPLDCLDVGGCDGGWYADILAAAKTKGLPTTKDYGPYTGEPSPCRFAATMPLYNVADYGYVGSGQGVPSTQAIKDAMVKFGPIAVAVAADDAFMRYTTGVFRGNSTGVNHAVVLIGWDDAKGVWLLRNQWTTRWGDNGYMWIAFGANRVGYGAMWATVSPLPPVPPGPTPPVPPDPIPPTPPQRLFTLTFPHAVQAGGTVHSFRTPVDIPKGSYWVIPAPTSEPPDSNVIPSK